MPSQLLAIVLVRSCADRECACLLSRCSDFMEKEITVRSTGDTIKLMLWDTAGQEMFSQLTRNYYRGLCRTQHGGEGGRRLRREFA